MVIRFILLVAAYMLCTWYAEAFITGPDQVTIFWPAAGVAFAAVLRYGWRMSFFIPVAVVLAHGWFVPVPTSFLPFSIASNWIGSLVGAWVALRVGPPQITVTSGFGMLRGGVVMVLVSAAVGSVGLIVSGMVPASNALPAFVRWSMGDLLGITGLPLSLVLWSAFRFEPMWTALGACISVLVLSSLIGLGPRGFMRVLGERIRRSISEHPFTLEDGTVLHVTVSVGLATP